MTYVEPELNVKGHQARSEGKSWNNHKLKDGNNVFRITPPFGVGHNGYWYKAWYLHWGFVDSEGSNRPVVCTKGIENFCPICEQAELLFKEKEHWKSK